MRVNEHMTKNIREIVLLLLASLISLQLAAQEKNLEKSFEKNCENSATAITSPERLQKQPDTLEMLRQAWTIRGADNKIYQLEYFFPLLAAPVPFPVAGNSSSNSPKDFATSIVIPSDNEAAQASEDDQFKEKPSVDNLVKNSETGKSQTQNQGGDKGKGKQQQNQYQKGKGK